MPGFDGTGPRGIGPMTGRGMGPCGRGMGFGRGAGRGFGRGFWAQEQFARPYPELTKEQEIADLKAERELIQRDIEALNKRLSELEKK
ncbi:MAG: DUF5320 domain-containing protein [Candidatus Aenigmarchaeota archaeon]|nr:DUF5320 domain-containing protein [Candidatus Aenigmarchaeota archaeon]